MGSPAARIIVDQHVCPFCSGPVAHFGGPILPAGCTTVLIGGLPAARFNDTAFCVGPPAIICSGSQTVYIGGLWAARVGDKTSHGGAIATGLLTVQIGG